jgi:hypothetical protein
MAQDTTELPPLVTEFSNVHIHRKDEVDCPRCSRPLEASEDESCFQLICRACFIGTSFYKPGFMPRWDG